MMSSITRKNVLCGLFLAVLLIGGWQVRTWNITLYAPNVDERMHQLIAGGRDLHEVWQFSLMETHPPLGHFLRYWWNGLGEGLVHDRMLSVWLGMLAIPVYFAMGRELAGRSGGLAAAALVAFGYQSVVQSQLVRNYALFIVLIGLMYWAFLRLRRGWSWPALGAYAAAGLLAVLTHYGALILATATTAVFAGRLWKRRLPIQQQAAWLGANALIATAFLVAALPQRTYLEPMLASQFPDGWMWPIFRLGAVGHLFEAILAICGSGVVLVLFLGDSIRRLFKERRDLDLGGILLAGIGISLLLHLLSLYPLDSYTRRHSWLIPLVAVLLAIWARAAWTEYVLGPLSMERPMMWKSYLTLGCAFAIMALIGVYLHQGYHYDDQEFPLPQSAWAEALQELESGMQPGDVILADFHVALHFFEGRHNLYRERLRLFGTDQISEAAFSTGRARTQPGRRYISSVGDFAALAQDAFPSDELRPKGWKIWLVNWAQTNPAQKQIAHCFNVPPSPVEVYSLDGETLLQTLEDSPDDLFFCRD